MAIVSVRTLFPGRRGQTDYMSHKTYDLVQEVVTDSDSDAEPEVLAAVDPIEPTKKVYQFGDAHPKDANAFCINRDPENSDESPRIWYVTSKFDTDPGEESAQGVDGQGEANAGDTVGNVPENPLARAAKWKTSSITRDEPVREWLQFNQDGSIAFVVPPAWTTSTIYKVGKFVQNAGNVYRYVVSGESDPASGPVIVPANPLIPIEDGDAFVVYVATLAQVTTDPAFAILSACLNSGKTPFDPPAMTDVSYPSIVVTKNIQSIQMSYQMLISNAVNSKRWKGVPPFCAKVLKFDAGNEKENNIAFVVGTWEVAMNPDGWLTRVLDSGYGTIHERPVPNPATPPPTIMKKVFSRHVDPHGEPYDNAVPMNGSGGILDPEDEPVYLSGIPRQMKLIDFNEHIPW